MIVTLDIDKLLKLGITPDEYTLLQLIANRAFVTAKKLQLKTPTLTESTLDKLVEKRLIHNLNNKGEFDTTKIMLRGKFIDEERKNDLFDDLLLHYPDSVIRPDGISDWLKTDLNRSRKLYNLAIRKDEVLHKHIMECLKKELEERYRTNKMSYIKRLPNWISTEEWKSWERFLTDSSTDTTDLGYGLKLE